jgi:hypothetical protein
MKKRRVTAIDDDEEDSKDDNDESDYGSNDEDDTDDDDEDDTAEGGDDVTPVALIFSRAVDNTRPLTCGNGQSLLCLPKKNEFRVATVMRC